MSRLPPTNDDSIDAPTTFSCYNSLVRSNHGSFMMNANL
jgi:hypothetical protein